jgi:transcriptional regulator with XRE-family HTH domain
MEAYTTICFWISSIYLKIYNMNIVGNRIKKLREKAGLTQEDMAGCFGISQSNYGRLEKDDERISVTRLKTFASILEVSTDFLLNGEGESKPLDHYLFPEHKEILLDVLNERKRQNIKFGANRLQHPFVWHVILSEEVGEVAKAALEWEFSGKTLTEYRKELVETSAVAIAAILDIDVHGEPVK